MKFNNIFSSSSSNKVTLIDRKKTSTQSTTSATESDDFATTLNKTKQKYDQSSLHAQGSIKGDKSKRDSTSQMIDSHKQHKPHAHNETNKLGTINEETEEQIISSDDDTLCSSNTSSLSTINSSELTINTEDDNSSDEEVKYNKDLHKETLNHLNNQVNQHTLGEEFINVYDDSSGSEDVESVASHQIEQCEDEKHISYDENSFDNSKQNLLLTLGLKEKTIELHKLLDGDLPVHDLSFNDYVQQLNKQSINNTFCISEEQLNNSDYMDALFAVVNNNDLQIDEVLNVKLTQDNVGKSNIVHNLHAYTEMSALPLNEFSSVLNQEINIDEEWSKVGDTDLVVDQTIMQKDLFSLDLQHDHSSAVNVNGANNQSNSFDVKTNTGNETVLNVEQKINNGKELIENLNGKISYMLGTKMHAAKIILNPSELGNIKIDIFMDENKTTINIAAQHESTLKLLTEHSSDLRNDFNGQGQQNLDFAFSQQNNQTKQENYSNNSAGVNFKSVLYSEDEQTDDAQSIIGTQNLGETPAKTNKIDMKI